MILPMMDVVCAGSGSGFSGQLLVGSVVPFYLGLGLYLLPFCTMEEAAMTSHSRAGWMIDVSAGSSSAVSQYFAWTMKCGHSDCKYNGSRTARVEMDFILIAEHPSSLTILCLTLTTTNGPSG